MSIFLRILAIISFSLCVFGSVFADEKEVIHTGSNAFPITIGAIGTGSIGSGTTNASGSEESGVKQGENEQKLEDDRKERAKTIDDINNFLIESYKIKIDKILADLNVSIERVTNNDPVAQTKLLGKIRSDITNKIQDINSHNVSVNRRKILSSIFIYIQQNLDAEIQKLAQQK